MEDEESVEDDWSSVTCAESALLFAESRLHGEDLNEQEQTVSIVMVDLST